MDRVKRSDQEAVTPAISVMLLVLLVVIIAIIVYAFIYGIPGGLEKSAFIAAEAGVVEINGTEYVAIQHRGGDDVFLNGSGAARGIPIDIRTTAAGGGPVLAGADAPVTWKAGQVLYLYNSAEGPKITIDRLTAAEGTGFPAGKLELVIIDTNAEVRIFGTTIAMDGSGPGPDDPPVAGFTADPYSGTAPLTVQFSDTSTGVIDSWSWDFGDGNNETVQSPSHTFADPGTYTVKLTVANSGGSNDFSREIVVAPEITGFTVEAWVKWNRDPAPPASDERWATIVVDGDRDSNSRYHLQHNEGNTLFEIAMTTDANRRFTRSTTSPVRDTWYHVVGVYNQDAGWLRIYVDGGGHQGSIGLTGTIIPSPGRYQIGGPAGIEWPGPTSMLRKFDGEIRGLGTYERAFTQAEIQARYDAGLPPA
ncbi:PKD domain-containing protein [Methanocalculus sp.]|uniref:PKD domain-containing protein n=1 Tax=Methanocalculus sp. TaxID=2004547 RepID=UPI00262577B7|nr:PKD domain-containing protein [Methanocalculus sp.]MDG6249748.1 PKD domain-containing protein [Methanocalculus sp.]